MLKFTKQGFLKDSDVFIDYNHSKADCKPHTHEFIEMMFCVSGRSMQLIDNVSYEIKRGSLLFINYKQVHEIKNTGDCLYYNILINPALFSSTLADSENAFELLSLSTFNELNSVDTSISSICFDEKETEKIESLISIMYAEQRIKDSNYTDVIRGLLSALLVFVFRKMSEGLGKAQKIKIPIEIIDYIDSHYNEKISLEDLSSRCFYNPSYFSKIFKECYGIKISDYIIRKRVENAYKLLVETNMSIEEICAGCGYTDKALFYKHFKKIKGITPGKIRK